ISRDSSVGGIPLAKESHRRSEFFEDCCSPERRGPGSVRGSFTSLERRWDGQRPAGSRHSSWAQGAQWRYIFEGQPDGSSCARLPPSLVSPRWTPTTLLGINMKTLHLARDEGSDRMADGGELPRDEGPARGQ